MAPRVWGGLLFVSFVDVWTETSVFPHPPFFFFFFWQNTVIKYLEEKKADWL